MESEFERDIRNACGTEELATAPLAPTGVDCANTATSKSARIQLPRDFFKMQNPPEPAPIPAADAGVAMQTTAGTGYYQASLREGSTISPSESVVSASQGSGTWPTSPTNLISTDATTPSSCPGQVSRLIVKFQEHERCDMFRCLPEYLPAKWRKVLTIFYAVIIFLALFFVVSMTLAVVGGGPGAVSDGYGAMDRPNPAYVFEPDCLPEHDHPHLIIAHRASVCCAPENTIPAIEKAIEFGAPVVEIDVMETKDGVLVLHHDPTLKRTTGEKGGTEDYTWDELQKFDAGVWFGYEWRGTRIPSLVDALKTMRGRALVLLDVKVPVDKPDVGARLAAAMKEADFDPKHAMTAALGCKLLSQYQQSTPTSKALYTVLIDMLSKEQRWYWPDDRNGFLKRVKSLAVAAVEQDFRSIDIADINKRRLHDGVKMLHENGFGYIVFTVNAPEHFSHLFHALVDGIETDDPRIPIGMLKHQDEKCGFKSFTNYSMAATSSTKSPLLGWRDAVEHDGNWSACNTPFSPSFWVMTLLGIPVVTAAIVVGIITCIKHRKVKNGQKAVASAELSTQGTRTIYLHRTADVHVAGKGLHEMLKGSDLRVDVTFEALTTLVETGEVTINVMDVENAGKRAQDMNHPHLLVK